MAEPDVTLTDYGLVLECIFCAAVLGRTATVWASGRQLAVCFYLLLGVSAAAGGTVHGFFPDDASLGSRSLWLITLLAIGLTALCAWLLGTSVLFPRPAARWLGFSAGGLVVLYSAVAIFFRRDFWLAMVVYLPASLLLLGGFGRMWRRDRHRSLLLGIIGLVLTFVAAAIQVARIGIHPIYFNHNACYHVVQALGLARLCVGLHHVLQRPPGFEPATVLNTSNVQNERAAAQVEHS